MSTAPDTYDAASAAPPLPPSLFRRCGTCDAVAILDPAAPPGARVYVCADPACGSRLHAAQSPPRCPYCLALASRTDRALTCHAGCQPLDLPRSEAVQAGWELAAAERLGPVEVEHYGMAGYHDARWDRYAPGRLVARWGRWDDDGAEKRSLEGRALHDGHAADVERIAAMSDALRAFAAAVKADPTLRVHGGPMPDMTWCDEWRRRLLLEVAPEACIVLHRAIVDRGGSFANVEDRLRHGAVARTTPFGSYSHAVAFWCGDHGTTLLGWGSALAGAGGAEATHSLPRGLRFGEMAVAPTHTSTGNARNANALAMEQDVTACFAAARVGGAWVAAVDGGGAAARAARCEGGRRLVAWELALVTLCDWGADVEVRAAGAARSRAGDGWRKLTVLEAVERVREVARREARKAAGGDWGAARHLTTEEGKAALRGARRALREALEAWALVPAKERRPPREAAASGDLERVAMAAGPMTGNHATWDMEAVR